MPFTKVTPTEVTLAKRTNANAAKFGFTEDMKSLSPGELAFVPLTEYKGDADDNPARGLALTLHRAAKEVGMTVVVTPATHSGVAGVVVRRATDAETTSASKRADSANKRADKIRKEKEAAKANGTVAAAKPTVRAGVKAA